MARTMEQIKQESIDKAVDQARSVLSSGGKITSSDEVICWMADKIAALESEKIALESWLDNTLMAFDAVKASGEIANSNVADMIELGINNKPQLSTTRLT